MMGGAWIDALLAALFLAALVVLYQLQWPQSTLAGGLGPRLRKVVSEERFERWQEKYYRILLRQAGFEPDTWRNLYWLAKILSTAFLPLLLLQILPARFEPGLAWLLLFALLGFFLPDAVLLLIRQRRKRKITLSLAYFLDLVVAFLQAGLSLEAAFRRAGREGFPANHPLSREIALVSLELDAGREPDAAFQALADRTGVPDLQGVAAALRSGLRLGAPVVRTLQAQAELLWTKRRELALRQINSAVIKSVFPLMLCGFPIFFVLAFFPAILELADLLGQLADVFR